MALRKLHETHVGTHCVVRIYRNRDYGEYVVKTSIKGRIVGGADGGGYFTDDKQDARNTAAVTIKALRKNARCR